MRIAVSDYDGTISSKGKLIGNVVAAVWKWREAGNRFGLATGRDFFMIKRETDKWGIPFDFLIVMNGGAIYDHDCTLLEKTLLPDSLVPVILQHPAALASMHYQLSSLDPLRLHLREGSWFPKIGVAYEEVGFEAALAMKELGQISFAYTTEDECAKWRLLLEEDFGDEVQVHPNQTTIDINAKGVDKAFGITALLERKGWTGRKVYTIGDGGNDVGMIQRFHGFAVEEAAPEIKRIAQKIYADVPDMLQRV